MIQEREASRVVLDPALSHGLAYAEAGRVMPVGDAIARLEGKYQSMARKPD
ncbi:MAG: hypothetical protein ACK4GT_00525 [Pararhodobacter sp.]